MRAKSWWWNNMKTRDNSEDPGVDGRIILEWVLREIGWKGVDWMHLARDRDQWQALMNTVMNLRLHKRWGI
jgi:hypothetical protein